MHNPDHSSSHSDTAIILEPGKLSTVALRQIWRKPVKMMLSPDCLTKIEASAATVIDLIAKRQTIYGINTGFGKFAHTSIPTTQLALLQENLLLSHCTGVGEALSPETSRLILALKINSLARGYSGIPLTTIQALLKFLNADLIPVIPSKGSVGASGDLAPLAHLSATLLGVGEVWQAQAANLWRKIPAKTALEYLHLEPLTLGPKEGLALINGTQASTALALVGLFEAETALNASISIGALTTDVALGSDIPFAAEIQEVRGQPGQIAVAAGYRKLLENSSLRASHLNCQKVQDPYCLRCQPQVLGACLDLINHATQTLLIEANAVSDNPLVFADNKTILSGGNFHAEPVAFAADQLALAIAEIGAIAERRIAMLMDQSISGLPAFLVEEGGINSGFMIAHVTAAALASENKALAHPHSVDSLPTSANQEDHVSMATNAARRLLDMAENTQTILGIEWLCAAQGLDFRRPLKSSISLENLHQQLRAKVPFYAKDRYLAPDISTARNLIGKVPLCGIS